jgi:hypothetical protein
MPSSADPPFEPDELPESDEELSEPLESDEELSDPLSLDEPDPPPSPELPLLPELSV